VHTLAPYLPMDRRQALARGEPLPDRAHGCALFADVSGFTPLTEALAQELGPQRGAEELTRRLNLVYTALIAELHRHGGSVIGFSGDAVVCWLDGDTGPRAGTCALAMQQALAPFRSLRTPAGTAISLGIKIAATCGPARRFLVGDPDIQQLEVLAGATMDRLGTIEALAARGEVVVGEEVAAALGPQAVFATWRSGPAGERCAVLSALHAPVPPTPWPAVPPPDDAAARPWLLRPVYERLEQGQEAFLAELRPAVALFLQFGGIDYDRDDAAGEKLDTYIRWVQRQVSRYEGNLMDVTMGDKGSFLYVAFGAPIAHEDDAARAVGAALALQSVPPELGFIGEVRIGISRGQMRAGAVGSPVRRTYGVLGNEVNVAARLMGQAAAGQTLVSARVQKRIHALFEFREVGALRLKGLAEPLPTWALVGRRTRADPEPLPARERPALVDRAAEQALLTQRLQTLCEGRGGGTIIIQGEAGIGKSRLVEELAQQWAGRGLAGLIGAGHSIEQGTPYRAWRDILRSYFDLDRIPLPEARRTHVQRAAQELPPEQAQRLPLLNDILGLDLPENDLTAGLPTELRHQSLVAFLLDLLRRRARQQPLVVVLEDAHWLDSLSWELAMHTARWLDACQEPLLLVLAMRPLAAADLGAAPLAQMLRLSSVQTIDLATLSPLETVDLVTARLGLPPGRLPEAVAELVRQRAEGNPFFAEELVFTLRDRGVIAMEHSLRATEKSGGPRCHVAGDLDQAAETLPDTLHGLVLARIDRLPPEQQLTLRVAAVIGRTFAFDALLYTLQQHTAISGAMLRTHLAALDILDLTPLDTIEPLTYMFRHIITREVAYQTLLFAQRRDLHRTVAQWYEGLHGAAGGGLLPASPALAPYLPLLVHHWHDAEETERERHYARLAGEQAAARYANAEAATYLSRALELTPEDDSAERFALLLAREQVYDAQGARPAQAADLGTLAGLAGRLGDAGKTARVGLRQARYAEATGDYARSIAAAQEAIAAAHSAGSAVVAAEGHTMWGGILRRRGEYDAAREQLAQALELYGREPDRAGEDKALSGLGMVAWRQGVYGEAQALLQRALEMRREAGDRTGEASIQNNLGAILQAVGEYDQAQAYHRRALELSRETGDWRGERITLNNLGEVARTLGQYGQALDHFRQSLAISRQIGDRYGEAILLNNLGAVLHALGEHRPALAHLQQSLEVQREVGARMVQGWALNNLGAVLLELGDTAGAEAHYRQALALRQQLGQGHYVAEDLAGLAAVALARGDTGQAHTQAVAMLAHMEGNPGLNGAEHPARAILACCRALRAAGDPRAAEVLAHAQALLQERAARIGDAALRRSFLENVAEHRAILE